MISSRACARRWSLSIVRGYGEALCLARLRAGRRRSDYELLLRWEQEAEAAGYPAPG